MRDSRFRGFVEAAPDAVVFADLSGTIVIANEPAETLFGYARAALVGEPLIALVPERFHEGSTAGVNLYGRRRDGSEVPLELSVVPVDTDDGPLVAVTIRAIDGRLALEASFAKLYRDAEQANRERVAFISQFSRELRTPLNAMLGWTRMLQTGALTPAKTARALEVIERSAIAQAQLIDDLVDASQIDAGALRLEVRALVLPDLVETAVAAVQPVLDAKGIVLERDVAPDLVPLVGDPDRLHQVVRSILLSATKLSRKGGRIWLSLRKQAESVTLLVKDEGLGIPKGFFLGLGPALSRTLVELHGGTFDVASEGVGQGATYTVVLPLEASSRAAQ